MNITRKFFDGLLRCRTKPIVFLSKDFSDSTGVQSTVYTKYLHFKRTARNRSDNTLTHTDASGQAKMVDVGAKNVTSRVAVASSRVLLGKVAYQLALENKLKKGDLVSTAKLAGILAAKQTHFLIPLCHSISLSSVEVNISFDSTHFAADVRAIARATGQTGVEMEALTAAAVSSLQIYDMCKAVSKDIVIERLHLVEKSGGSSGNYLRT
jgi:molybdenum cofactor biosynthesis protein MoaC